MISTVGSVLFYALVAAASPLVLTATFVVIRSEHTRRNSIVFLIGFVTGTTIAAAAGLVVGQAAVERLDSHATMEALLALLLGVALIATGLRSRRGTLPSESSRGLAGANMARLSHVRAGTALSVAALLGFGGPKRLILTILAMASISQAELRDVENLTLVVLYIVVATVLVSVPVGAVVIGGRRAAAIIGRGESWLATNAALLRRWLALGLGVALVVDGLVRLA